MTGTAGGQGSMCPDELDCITRAVAMYRAILDEAERLSRPQVSSLDPEAELRDRLPAIFAQLSPAARGMLADHLDHTIELVAFLNRLPAAA